MVTRLRIQNEGQRKLKWKASKTEEFGEMWGSVTVVNVPCVQMISTFSLIWTSIGWFLWEWQRQVRLERHRVERRIREGSWFENSNFSVEEVIKLTVLVAQLLRSLTAMDWDMWGYTLWEKSETWSTSWLSCTDRRVEDNVIEGALWTEHRGKLPKILHCNGSGQNRGHNDKPHSRMDRVRNYNCQWLLEAT